MNGIRSVSGGRKRWAVEREVGGNVIKIKRLGDTSRTKLKSINLRALIITHFHETAMGWDGQSIFHKKQRLFIAPVISVYGHSSGLHSFKMRS